MSGRYEPHDECMPCDLASWDEMPSHWHIGRIKYMTMMNPSKSEVRHLKSDTPVTFLPMESIGDDGSLDVSKERPLHSVLSGYTYLAEGDVCVAKITPCFENGKGAIAHGLRNRIGFATTEVIPMRCNRTTDSQYLYYFLTCAPFNLDAEASMYGAGGQKRVADSFVANYSAAIPPLEEQKQIASFLDYETAKIDALVEKQQQLIALLGEKRQAVISHAVTKGLNPDAPMRDSGIEWLGEVPEHWDVKKLKHSATSIQTGPFGSLLHAEDYISGGVPLVHPAHMVDGIIVPEDKCTVDAATQARLVRHQLKEGDLVCARRGELGRCAVVRAEHDGWLCGTGSLRISFSAELLGEYAFYLVSSDGFKGELSLASRGSTMENLNPDTIGSVHIPVPPVEEQTVILDTIAEKSLRLDALESLAVEKSELLQERRTALISAAVTGKIDVRGWKPPSSPATPETEMEVA